MPCGLGLWAGLDLLGGADGGPRALGWVLVESHVSYSSMLDRSGNAHLPNSPGV